MLSQPPSLPTTDEGMLADLQRLRRFAGPASEFWPALLKALARLVEARRGLLILRDPASPDRLRRLAEWSDQSAADPAVLEFNQSLPELSRLCLEEGRVSRPLGPTARHGGNHHALAVRLQFQGTRDECLAALLAPAQAGSDHEEALVRLALAADIPADYQTQQMLQQSARDVEKFAAVLDVMVAVNAEPHFRAAALAFCNALATRFDCERVSLGWLHGGFVRLQAISRTEKFDKHMAAVQALETVMEEALDQDDEVTWPLPDGQNLVAREHEKFAHDHRVAHLVSVPFRLDHQPVAALTAERAQRPFSPAEVQQWRLACDQAVRRLSDLRNHDRWFGARWAAALKEHSATLLGPQHTWAKVLSLLGLVLLVALFLPIYPYRVEGNFILRSDEVAYLTAPFDGYIKSVQVRPGDELAAEGVLLTLNTDQLELEEAAAIADQTRYLREAEKARANNTLAEMRIAQALADQATARLDLVRYRLRQASLRAPFHSVVIEGDLRQRIGAPVKQGDALFRLARTDALYVEAEVNERDVHEILNRKEGEIAFVAQPQRKFPIRVVRLEPAGLPKEKENLFLLRCALAASVEPWWRPGMSGVCKLPVEDRTLFWILTHRTVDFLRMLLWW